MFLGIANAISGIKSGGLSFIKDNLKLYLDFKSNKSDTLKFPSEGSTSFDGSNDYISAGQSSNLGTGTNFTISLWIKNEGTAKSYITQIQKGVGSSGLAILANSLGTGANAGYVTALAWNGSTHLYLSFDGSIDDGNWHHIAFTTTSSAQVLYFDGQSVDTDTIAFTNAFDSNPIVIGARGNASEFFTGKMANMAIWSRVLEPEEIQSIMNKSYSQLKGVEKTSLVSWWGLDNSSDRGADFWDVGVFTQEGSPTTSTYSNGLLNVVGNGNNTGAKFSFPSTGSTSIEGYNQYEFSFDIKITSGAGSRVKIQYHYSNAISSTFNDQIDTTEAPNQEFKRFVTTLYSDDSYSSNRYFVFVQSGSTVCEFQVKNIVLKPITANDSKGSNHGQLVQEATTTTSVYGSNAPILPRAVDVAKEGQADAIGDGSASFNGSTDYIQIDSSNFPNLQPYTISAWFKIDTLQASAILAWGDESHYERRSMFIWNGGSGSVWKLIPSIYGENPVGATALEINRWYHGALVVNPTAKTYEIYLNGILDGSGSFSNDFVSWGGTTGYIGKTGSNERFDGNISQVGLWQGALTQAQIQSVMESTSYSKIPADVKSTLGAERVLNSDFSDGENIWDLNNANVVNEVLEIDEGAFSYYAQQAVDGDGSNYRQFESGYLMKLEIVVDEYTSGSTIIYATGNNIGTFDSAGTHTIYYKPSANEYFRLRSGGSGFEGKISSVSIKRVTNDIVAYYPLDGDNSIPALSFDGTDDTIQTSAHDTLVDTTYTFWAKSDVTGANGGLFGHGGVTKSSFHFNYFGATGGARFYLGGSYFKKWDIDEQDDGQWHHYAIVADADSLANLKLYVDGVEQTVALSDSSGSPDAFTQSLTIGSDATNGNEWEGSIAQFAVYSDLKDADFIKAQYDKAIDADLSSDSGLVGYWKMNNGTTVNDLSGNGNNGTVSGATLIQNAVALDSTDNNNDGSLN